MLILLKINTTDSMSIEFLEKAKEHRKMSQVVGDAIAHYARTPEGRKSLEMLESVKKPAIRTNVAKSVAPENVRQGKKENVNKKGSLKQTKSIDDFLS